MATSPDHAGLRYVQAEGFTSGRAGKTPLWVVIHTMEAGESSTRAESTAAYFANPPDGRRVSSHYCVDQDSVVQCVRLSDTAWTVGNTPGNQRGINWELAGFARQARADWLDAASLGMFRMMAPYVRSDCARFGIPFERRTVAELRALKPGFTTHNDLRLAFGTTTHTDPGPSFPWDVFLPIITRAQEGAEDMGRMLMAYDDSTAGQPGAAVWVGDGLTRRRIGARLIPAGQNATGDPAAKEFTDSANNFALWIGGVAASLAPAREGKPAEVGPRGFACPGPWPSTTLDQILGVIEAPPTGETWPVSLRFEGTASVDQLPESRVAGAINQRMDS